MHLPYIICGLLALLLSSALDNVRGPLLPLLTSTLHLSNADSSLLLVGGNIAAVVSTFSVGFLLHRLGEKRLTVFFCGLGFLASLFGYGVNNGTTILFFALLLGSVISGMGALSNLFIIQGTPPQTRSRFLCALHMMYGLGSFFGPWALSMLLGRGWAWPSIVILLAAPLLLFGAWVGTRIADIPVPEARPARIRWGAAQMIIYVTFVAYCAGEVLCSAWLSTYLVQHRSFTPETAALYVAAFFILMTTTRGLCFFALRPENERRILVGSVGLGIFFFVLGLSGQEWAFSAVGVLGPFFPIFLSQITQRFPESAKALSLRLIIFFQSSMVVFNLAMGKLTDLFGIRIVYLAPLLLLIITLGGTLLYFAPAMTRSPRTLDPIS